MQQKLLERDELARAEEEKVKSKPKTWYDKKSREGASRWKPRC